MRKKPLKYPKRLSMNIDDAIHKYIRTRAAFMGITITEWIMLAVMKQIEEESKYV